MNVNAMVPFHDAIMIGIAVMAVPGAVVAVLIWMLIPLHIKKLRLEADLQIARIELAATVAENELRNSVFGDISRRLTAFERHVERLMDSSSEKRSEKGAS